MVRRLTPAMLPPAYLRRTGLTVKHVFPESWTEQEINVHDFNDCPCQPTMVQLFCTCGAQHGGYRWAVYHRALPHQEAAT